LDRSAQPAVFDACDEPRLPFRLCGRVETANLVNWRSVDELMLAEIDEAIERIDTHLNA
jgi:hypothetical protein